MFSGRTIPMSIKMRDFGVTSSGEKVSLYKLTNSIGAYVKILDYGGIIQTVAVPDKNGNLTDVCLGYDNVISYEKYDGYLGAVIGRFANRIKNGTFDLNGKTYNLAINDRPNHLHGGIKGFDKYIWASEIVDNNLLRLSHCSPDGDEGYPGKLNVTVEYRFDNDNNLSIHYAAQSDADTVVNLTNHLYVNLNGHGNGTILNNKLKINADYFTEIDKNCLSTGIITKVDNTPFDFRVEKRIDRDILKDNTQLKYGSGYDHNYILGSTGVMKEIAELTSEKSGIRMTTISTMPCVQLYTGNYLSDFIGKGSKLYARQCGLCLETQLYPMECRNIFSPVLAAGAIYDHKTIYHFDNTYTNLPLK